MTVEPQTLFLMLVIFQIKHYISDFPLQTPYMLKKVLPTWEFVVPLAVHCSVHATFTALICLYFKPELWWLCFVDFAAHFIMDRIKAGDRYLGRFRDRDKASYWNCLGFDQLFHHLTHYFIVFCIVTS